MNDRQKFYAYLSAAIFCYLWGLGALWAAHAYVIPERTFFVLGILPVMAGVLLMVMALQYRMYMLDDDEETEDASNSPA